MFLAAITRPIKTAKLDSGGDDMEIAVYGYFVDLWKILTRWCNLSPENQL